MVSDTLTTFTLPAAGFISTGAITLVFFDITFHYFYFLLLLIMSKKLFLKY